MQDVKESRQVNNSFEKGTLVVVVSGKVDASKYVDPSVSVARVLEVGEHDLFLEHDSSNHIVVSKQLCVPIQMKSDVLIKSVPLLPKIGDMIMYHGKLSWRDKGPTTVTGTVYEIEYKLGAPVYAKVLSSNSGMKVVPYENLLVLQTKPS